MSNLTDEEREEVIDVLTMLAKGATGNVQRRYWELMKAEIAARSPEQIIRMEISRGLRAA